MTATLYSGAKAAQQKLKPKATLAKSISLGMKFSGDINESYQFDGLLGEKLAGSTENTKPVCQAKASFREASYKQIPSVEVYLYLLCAQGEQKIDLNSHRFFINPKEVQPQVNLSYFTMKIKKIKVEIVDLSIKSPKLK